MIIFISVRFLVLFFFLLGESFLLAESKAARAARALIYASHPSSPTAGEAHSRGSTSIR